MNGFELYKKYTTVGESVGRDTNEWAYAQTLMEALYLVGVTRLFDMLEKAEEQDMRIAIVYQDLISATSTAPCTVQLVSHEAASGGYERRPQVWAYSYHTL